MIGPWYVTTDWRRRTAWGSPCDVSDFGKVVLDGRSLTCHKAAIEAFTVYDHIREHHGYRLTGNDTGFYSCRHMQHNPSMPYSYHAWALALDINWLENPAGNKLVTDIPKAMRDDLLALRTNSGARVFRWGADWDWDGIWTDHSYVDAMHWEMVAHPLDIATGIAGYDLSQPEERTMLGFNIGPKGAPSVQGQEAETLQLMLLAFGEALPKFGADGFAGDETRTALASFQSKRDITGEDGAVGPQTYTAFHQPSTSVDLSDYAKKADVAKWQKAHAADSDAHHA